VVRPYPRRIAGTPQGVGFDSESKQFTLTYRTRPPVASAGVRSLRTEVFLPRLHFPYGYHATVAGAEVLSGSGEELLVLRNLPGSEFVTVTVSPSPMPG